MNRIQRILNIALASIVLAISVIIGCLRTSDLSTNAEGEESNVELVLDDTYDHVRNGARLILTYDRQSNAFKGTVENTTAETLKQVRVEVHLSNGKELGPTPAADLAPGEKRDVLLAAISTNFDTWTAHPEVGEGEHGSGGEHGEHDSEHGGEHDREAEDEHN